jgi:glycosyltransferase involved in cell wall biosynthesis
LIAEDQFAERFAESRTDGGCGREIGGTPVSWLEAGGAFSWRDLGLEIPEVFVFTGWCHPEFNRLAREVKQRGGMAVSMVDNCRKHNLRQAFGRFWFRLRFLPWLDFVFVPGEDGRELMRYFGCSDDQVLTGLYGADPAIFTPGPALSARPVDFLFVGQFIQRKGLQTLVEAIGRVRSLGIPCSVLCVGSGPMDGDLQSANIPIRPACPAGQVAEHMRAAKFLVLPSVEDHWGVVVHEAALCGCGLALSSGVASRFDLLTASNGFLFRHSNAAELSERMIQALSSTEEWRAQALRTSVELAARFSPERWAGVVAGLAGRTRTAPAGCRARRSPGAATSPPGAGASTPH